LNAVPIRNLSIIEPADICTRLASAPHPCTLVFKPQPFEPRRVATTMPTTRPAVADLHNAVTTARGERHAIIPYPLRNRHDDRAAPRIYLSVEPRIRTVIRSPTANEIDSASRVWGFLCQEYDSAFPIFGRRIHHEPTRRSPGIGWNQRSDPEYHCRLPLSFRAVP